MVGLKAMIIPKDTKEKIPTMLQNRLHTIQKKSLKKIPRKNVRMKKKKKETILSLAPTLNQIERLTECLGLRESVVIEAYV